MALCEFAECGGINEGVHGTFHMSGMLCVVAERFMWRGVREIEVRHARSKSLSEILLHCAVDAQVGAKDDRHDLNARWNNECSQVRLRRLPQLYPGRLKPDPSKK